MRRGILAAVTAIGAAGAAFIAECARRGLKAHWDAANTMSLKIAAKFGYTLKEEYTALCFEEGI